MDNAQQRPKGDKYAKTIFETREHKELNKTETEPKMPQSRTQRKTNPTKIRDAKEGRTRVRSTPEKGEAQEKKRVVGSTRKIELTKKHSHAQ